MPRKKEEILREINQAFERVEQRGGLFVTDFLSPEEQHYFQEVSYNFRNLFIRLEGGVPLSERRRGFITDNKDILEYLDLEKYLLGVEVIFKERILPYTLKEILISNKIDEGKLGDIWEVNNKIQMVVGREIEEDLEKVLKVLGIEYSSMPLNLLTPPKKARILKTTEASLRLDAIASFAFNIPRSRMQELIKNSAIVVNNKTISYPHYEVKEGDFVNVRNLGYFKIKTIKETKRGRYYIEIERH
ncbi:MAG: S4 domain-containing protein [Dictyoglomaceae bacterium]